MALVLLVIISKVKTRTMNESVAMSAQLEYEFNEKIQSKRVSVLLKCHEDKIKLFNLLLETWPTGVYIEELTMNNHKATIKGFALEMRELEILSQKKYKKFIIQKLTAKHAGWLYLCDIWYS